MNIQMIEESRIQQQVRLDGLRDATERNRRGQFATRPELALQIVRYLRNLWKKRSDRIQFIEPAIGTGAFYSAVRQVFKPEQIERATGVELDTAFADAARSLWGDTGLQVTTGDFTQLKPPLGEERFNLVLTNPPYIRHHHLTGDDKLRLKTAVKEMLGLEISGLAGLYAYFLLLSHAWMKEGGIGVWLIPSEFMNVNYGSVVQDYLMHRVRLLHIHRFCPSDTQFCDALVTSAIVVFQKVAPSPTHNARFTFGGSILEPELDEQVSIDKLRTLSKWTVYPHQPGSRLRPDHETVTLGQLFTVKRGVATGANRFFILPRQEAVRQGIPEEAVRPILPSPRYLRVSVIERDKDGWPILEDQLALIDCSLPEQELRQRFRRFWSYLESGIVQDIHKGYLTSRRSPWYSQEKRDPAPFLCTYMGRNNNSSGPFRFIWNKSDAIPANVYLLLYPKGLLREVLKEQPRLYERVFKALQMITPEEFTSEGRVYGGGLHKLEPKELGSVSAARIIEEVDSIKPAVQLSLDMPL